MLVRRIEFFTEVVKYAICGQLCEFAEDMTSNFVIQAIFRRASIECKLMNNCSENTSPTSIEIFQLVRLVLPVFHSLCIDFFYVHFSAGT